MSRWSFLQEEDIPRFWQHILVHVYGTSDLSQVKPHGITDLEGHAFFLAVDSAFTPCTRMQGLVPVDQELVQYLAGWGRNMTRSQHEYGGPIGPNANHFARRAFNGFIKTVLQAISVNQLRYFSDGRIMYGCFEVPQWMIDHCLSGLQDEARHVNRIWDEDPQSRDYIRAAA